VYAYRRLKITDLRGPAFRSSFARRQVAARMAVVSLPSDFSDKRSCSWSEFVLSYSPVPRMSLYSVTTRARLDAPDGQFPKSICVVVKFVSRLNKLDGSFFRNICMSFVTGAAGRPIGETSTLPPTPGSNSNPSSVTPQQIAERKREERHKYLGIAFAEFQEGASHLLLRIHHLGNWGNELVAASWRH
jgi:hypothetical protein